MMILDFAQMDAKICLKQETREVEYEIRENISPEYFQRIFQSSTNKNLQRTLKRIKRLRLLMFFKQFKSPRRQ